MTDHMEEGLILLKCIGCSTPTLFRLENCHDAEREYTANTHCIACEREDQYRRIRRRELDPKLVENQRIDCPRPDNCHEANRGESDV